MVEHSFWMKLANATWRCRPRSYARSNRHLEPNRVVASFGVLEIPKILLRTSVSWRQRIGTCVKKFKTGNFREDLFYRLSMITVKLPPLRARKGDVGLLAKSLLDQINDQFESTSRPGYVRKSLPSETLKYMENYHWPGNVRELYNALVQAAIMQDSPKLKPRDIASAIASAPSASTATASDVVLGDGFDIDEHLDDIRKVLLRRAMDQSHGVKARAAELLGMKHYQTLDAQLKRLGVQ